MLGDASAGTAIAVGPLVRQACERHLRDRERAEDDRHWYQFNEQRADHIITFFESVLKLPDILDEDGHGAPFLLQPWQAFILGTLFGWVDARGFRRFREAYIEIGKGNGKTPMCAGIGLYGLLMDGERAAEIYAAAADQDQARILFRDAVRMVEASPDIFAAVKMAGGQHIWQISDPSSLSFFQTFSRESGAKSGPRPHMGLIDELHEHGSPQISIKVRAGAKRRTQPLFLEITNSGFDRTSICWEHHEHSRRVLEQALTDEQWFAYVCALDEGDDPLEDESCWPKVNPNQGVSVTVDYLRRQVASARNIPSETNTVLRLNFCVWTNANERAIDMGLWNACQPPPADDDLFGDPCFGALDLGQSDDFSAWVRGWFRDDGGVVVKCRFWIPQAALEKYPDRPYAYWREQGWLTVTDGDTTDYGTVEAAVLEDCQRDGVREVAFDKRFALQMAQNLTGAGVTMVDLPQGFQLTEACRLLGEFIAEREFRHGFNEILTWMASNYVEIRGRKGEVRPDKDAAGEKIDGIVAVIMLLALWIRQPKQPAPGVMAEWVEF